MVSRCPKSAYLLGQRCERVVEDVIGDASALRDALSFVERPMNAEINSALTIFFFRLGKG